MLTLFRPATGEVRAQGVTSVPNTVLHPWLQATLTQVLAAQPVPSPLPVDQPLWRRWAQWLGHAPTDALPPLRLLLVLENLTGHYTAVFVRWPCAHGVLPFYTPIAGSWLNMAEPRPSQCRGAA